MNIVSTLSTILKTTPVYVWFILGYLIVIGIMASKTRPVPVYSLPFMPLILLATNNKYFDNIFFITSLTLGLLIGLLINYKTDLTVSKLKKTITMPGSYFTLLFLLIFFIVSYVFGVLDATAPEIAAQYFYLKLILNGTFLGYYAGKISTYLYKYIQHQ